MGKYRHDISERAVRFDLLHGMSMKTAAAKYKCSVGLIKRIKDDQRTLRHAKKQIPKAQLCECCGIRPKAPGNRFLCDPCFKGQDLDYDLDMDEGLWDPNNSWDDLDFDR